MVTSIKVKLQNQEDRQTINNSFKVSELNLQNFNLTKLLEYRVQKKDILSFLGFPSAALSDA